MKTIFLLLAVVAAANAIAFGDVIKQEWQEFKLSHKKSYTSDTEEKFRMKIFMENKHKIALHNQEYEQGKVGFKLGLNKYADMLNTEFTRMMNGYKRNVSEENELGATFISPANMKLAKTVDWRAQGAVTPVKDQGACGSCWAFSATGSLEGQNFRKTGKLVSLSEQNLIDCSEGIGNQGCNGGSTVLAFLYILYNKGIDTEKSYPYRGLDDNCHFEANEVGATDMGFAAITHGDEEELMEAVGALGPISVAVDASLPSFQLYKEGVYDDPKCSSENLDHGMLVVGYGTDDKGKDYWLVKNSWGTTWGIKGYVKMARNKGNLCGIATIPIFPVV